MLKQKDKRSLNKSIDMLRIVIMAVLFGAVILLFLFKLIQLQIVDEEYYTENAVPKTYK